MKDILVLCPTQREYRDLPAIAASLNCRVVFEDLFIGHFYDVLSRNYAGSQIPDLLSLVDQKIEKYRKQNLAGVTSADGYPGMCASSIMATKLGLIAPKTDKILTCGHKYYSRLAQKELVPEATASFQLLNPTDLSNLESIKGFPLFLKPVRSCFSINATKVSTIDELKNLAPSTLLPEGYLKPFNDLLKAHTSYPLDASYLLLEELLEGQQVTLEGYAYNGAVSIMGIVDSIMFPGTISFKRFQYPSLLPNDVQRRMEDIARRFISGIGFDNGLFNIEFMYNPANNKIHIIEINPRIASQFPDLYQKVDGTSSYAVLLEASLGQEPTFKHRQGDFKVAASCVLRTFQDQMVLKVPTPESINKLHTLYPDALVEIHAQEGRRLSDQMQDVGSYRYGLINIGANSESELQEKLDKCRDLLEFQFAPLSESLSLAQPNPIPVGAR